MYWSAGCCLVLRDGEIETGGENGCYCRCVHVQEQFSERGKSGGGESALVSLLFPSMLFRGKIDFLSDRQEEKLVPRFGICPINISPVPKLGKRGRKKVGNKEKARKRPPIQIFSSRSFPSKKKGGERKRENEK